MSESAKGLYLRRKRRFDYRIPESVESLCLRKSSERSDRQFSESEESVCLRYQWRFGRRIRETEERLYLRTLLGGRNPGPHLWYQSWYLCWVFLGPEGDLY